MAAKLISVINKINMRSWLGVKKEAAQHNSSRAATVNTMLIRLREGIATQEKRLVFVWKLYQILSLFGWW